MARGLDGATLTDALDEIVRLFGEGEGLPDRIAARLEQVVDRAAAGDVRDEIAVVDMAAREVRPGPLLDMILADLRAARGVVMG